MARKLRKAQRRRATRVRKLDKISLRPVAEAEGDRLNLIQKDAQRDLLHLSRNGLDIGGELQLVTDTSTIPARYTGLLEIQFAAEVRYGTAWLIGPRTLATAAHNLLHPEVGEAVGLEVGMAYDGESARGGWHRIVDCRFDEGWRKQPNPEEGYDYAVLKIGDSTVGDQLGWFRFEDYKDAKLENMPVSIFGYPMDSERFQQFHMYRGRGQVHDVNSRLIRYNCDTDEGMSGGPVIVRFGEQRVAVGIHVAGGIDSNAGTRINDAAHALFNKYRNW